MRIICRRFISTSCAQDLGINWNDYGRLQQITVTAKRHTSNTLKVWPHEADIPVAPRAALLTLIVHMATWSFLSSSKNPYCECICSSPQFPPVSRLWRKMWQPDNAEQRKRPRWEKADFILHTHSINGRPPNRVSICKRFHHNYLNSSYSSAILYEYIFEPCRWNVWTVDACHKRLKTVHIFWWYMQEAISLNNETLLRRITCIKKTTWPHTVCKKITWK